ncbi:MAG: hypothetical protein GVY27_09050, partial [Deinococcus-Thermus bacterium]|nr:hypothetical protein [Deinococcota bacterium]
MTMDLEGPAATGPAANGSRPAANTGVTEAAAADARAAAARDAARLVDLASRTNLGTLDALIAGAKQAAAEPGQYAGAARTARR